MKLRAKAYLRIAAEDWWEKYDIVDDFEEDLTRVRSLLNGKWGLVNKTGKEVVEPKYDAIGPFSQGLAKVQLDDKWGFIDKQGEEVIPLKYDEVGEFRNGLAPVELDGKYGYINKKGNEVVKPKYDEVKWFKEGFAKVWLNDKELLIDKQGREIPKKYLTAVMLGGDIDRILEIEGSK